MPSDSMSAGEILDKLASADSAQWSTLTNEDLVFAAEVALRGELMFQLTNRQAWFRAGDTSLPQAHSSDTIALCVLALKTKPQLSPWAAPLLTEINEDTDAAHVAKDDTPE